MSRDETPSFKTLLREPPCIDDFPDTTDLRRELPREADLDSDSLSQGAPAPETRS